VCGIAGIVLGDEGAEVDGAAVRRMTEALHHRGPDDDGYHISGPVGLGMRRLSIIDIAGGKQPMQNEDGTLQLVYNGEIYNFRELRARLQSHHRFATASDAEVVVHAYEDDREGFIADLRGMFAFALWDDRRTRLTLAVDALGIKPLYYSADEGRIVFASELGALLEAGRISRDLDFDALGQYFALGYVPAPRTILRAVSKLPPAGVLRWSPDAGVETGTYWDPAAFTPVPVDDRSDLRKRLRAMLLDAVSSHLVSDVPVGAFLSGGIDSSTVVALMSEAMDEPVRTFSIGFGDREHDELHLAREVAKRFRTDHHEFVVEPDAVDVLPKLVSHFGEPFADSSALPTYHVSRLASDHVKVALSGDGGDELFIGYTTYLGLEAARYAQRLPAAVRGLVARAPARVPALSGRAADRMTRLLKVARDTTRPPRESYLSKITLVGSGDLRRVLSPDLLRKLDTATAYEPIESALVGASRNGDAHPLEPFLRANLAVSLPGDMLVKVDRMSMANSLEVRVPLLDRVLAEFALSIPVPVRLPRWRLKGLLKDAMADTLPKAILEHRKHGFTIPVSRWFRGDLWDYARDVLLSSEARDRGLLRPEGIEELIREHRYGGRNVGPTLWSLLVFELWCGQFLA
jgi:asparagine synthase (glutamine-hydrolysing)